MEDFAWRPRGNDEAEFILSQGRGKFGGGLIFEVGGKAVEVEDEGSKVEWGVEAEGKTLEDYSEGKCRMPAIA